mmetsp:Transcript_44599/g.49999  ORF Transcript_44599/g.49999 Transcript_44599/m.49999 type:complete len:144 (-) Transcript_44599:651-1082(-)
MDRLQGVPAISLEVFDVGRGMVRLYHCGDQGGRFARQKAPPFIATPPGGIGKERRQKALVAVCSIAGILPLGKVLVPDPVLVVQSPAPESFRIVECSKHLVQKGRIGTENHRPRVPLEGVLLHRPARGVVAEPVHNVGSHKEI